MSGQEAAAEVSSPGNFRGPNWAEVSEGIALCVKRGRRLWRLPAVGPARRGVSFRAQRWSCGFCHTETCEVLSAVKGVWFQSAHRSRSSRPASLAIRSSSEGHTKRCGDCKVWAAPSLIQ
jgi:hypothetical protein